MTFNVNTLEKGLPRSVFYIIGGSSVYFFLMIDGEIWAPLSPVVFCRLSMAVQISGNTFSWQAVDRAEATDGKSAR